MTAAEQKSVDRLVQALHDMRNDNAQFREDVKRQVEAINSKVEKKHVPITLETDILSLVQTCFNDSLKGVLTKYDSPLAKIATEVITEHKDELKAIIKGAFSEVIRTEDFKASIVSAFSHKVARTIISNNDGTFDKVANELKQDPVFKAKMAIAVSNVVEECLVKKQNP